MGKYTNEKTQYYINIIKVISEHEDFGKRNPVDIGIECGFTEGDILGAIEMLRTMKAKEDEKEKKSAEEKDRENYYFLLHPYGEYGYIVSVDIESWKTKIVKKIYMQKIGHWQIKRNIFVWTLRIGYEKTVYWLNLDSGEQRKLLTDEDIRNILIRKSDVCIITYDTIILWRNDGSICKKEVHIDGYSALLEVEGAIYVANSLSVSKLDGELNVEKIWEKGYGSEYDYYMGAIEYLDGKLSWYSYKENSHLFSNNTWSYRKYTEGESSYSTDVKGYVASTYTMTYGIITGVFTQNYRLLQKEIRSIDNKHSICAFNRKLDEKSNHGQVISIPDKDIFIGVGGNDTREFLLKIDLRNERQAVELPVEFTKDVEEIIYQ